MDVTYTYGGKFIDNELIVEQAGCGKTMFIQNLAKKMLES